MNINYQLNDYGMAIIPHLLSEHEQLDMWQGFQESLAHVTSDMLLPHDNLFDQSKAIKESLGASQGQVYKHHFNHAPYVWNIRSNSKVLSQFAEIYNCDINELVCSFDGIGYHHFTTRKYGSRETSWHIDQSLSSAIAGICEGYQSWISNFEQTESEGGIMLLVNSHRLHSEFAIAFPDFCEKSLKTGFIKYEKHHIGWFITQGCYFHRVTCPAGSMFIWDSRVIHCIVKPEIGSHIRHVVYFSAKPRNRIPPRVIKKRISLFEENRGTNHDPEKSIAVPVWPNIRDSTKCLTYAIPRELAHANICSTENIVMTTVIKHLVGYETNFLK